MHIARIFPFANLRRLSSYKTPHELLGMNINVDLHVPLYLWGPDMIAFHIRGEHFIFLEFICSSLMRVTQKLLTSHQISLNQHTFDLLRIDLSNLLLLSFKLYDKCLMTYVLVFLIIDSYVPYFRTWRKINIYTQIYIHTFVYMRVNISPIQHIFSS